MRRTSVVGWALWSAVLSGCGGPPPPAAQPPVVPPPPLAPAPAPAPPRADVSREVNALLDAWHASAARADEEAYFGAMTEDAVFLGTDETERWNKAAFRAYAHPHFSKGKGWKFRATRRDLALGPEGRVVWFDETLATENLGPARGSGVVLRGPDGRYRIAHYNLTITVPNERFDEVKALLASPKPPAPPPPAEVVRPEPKPAPTKKPKPGKKKPLRVGPDQLGF